MNTKTMAISRLHSRVRQALLGALLAGAALAAPAWAQDQAPTPAAVLTAIENVKVPDGDESLQLENGSTANFWYSHEFEFEGKHWFTGFIWYSRSDEAAKDNDIAGPEVTVRLGQFTAELTHPGQTPAYTFRFVDRKIGFFGARDLPETTDDKRKALTYSTADHRMLLAVPTASFDNGFTTKGYSIFVFNPGKKESDDGRIWTYLGQVLTGEDNSAACDEGAVMPCMSNDGALSFLPGEGPLPQIKVKMSGTTIEGPGKTRKLDASDDTLYVYDSKTTAYALKN